jgi:hypothetical protein
MSKCVVCGRERDDLIDDQCADCTMDDFWESVGRPRQFSPVGQGDILAGLAVVVEFEGYAPYDSGTPADWEQCGQCGGYRIRWRAGDSLHHFKCVDCGHHWTESEAAK